MITELILYIIFGALALGTAVAVILSKSAVHAAMFLVVNFFCMAVFFLILNAQFVAVVQILVYAGAIMVLFVFVIMLLNAVGILEQVRDQIPSNKILGPILVIILLAEGVVAVRAGMFTIRAVNTQPLTDTNFGAPVSIAERLFTVYLLPFELASVLLLIAMIGALVIGKRRLT